MKTNSKTNFHGDEIEARRALLGALFPLLLDKAGLCFSQDSIILFSGFSPRDREAENDFQGEETRTVPPPLAMLAGGIAELVLNGAEVTLAERAILITRGNASAGQWEEIGAFSEKILSEKVAHAVFGRKKRRHLRPRDAERGESHAIRVHGGPLGREGLPAGAIRGDDLDALLRAIGGKRPASRSDLATPGASNGKERSKAKRLWITHLAQMAIMGGEAHCDGETLTFLAPESETVEGTHALERKELIRRCKLAGTLVDLFFPHISLRADGGRVEILRENADPRKWQATTDLLEASAHNRRGSEKGVATAKQTAPIGTAGGLSKTRQQRLGNLSDADSAKLLRWVSEVLEIDII